MKVDNFIYLFIMLKFVVENSNKLQEIGFRKKNKLNVFTFRANNTCYVIYP